LGWPYRALRRQERAKSYDPYYDIPDLIQAIAPRPVTVLNSLHPERLLPHLIH
jgi:hypothetical protein